MLISVLPKPPKIFETIPGYELVDADGDGKKDDIVAVIYVKAEDNGKFTVYLLKADALDKNGKVKDDALSASNVPKVNINPDVTGYTKATKNFLAVYANVYPNSSLAGEWKLTDVQGNALVPVEE